ncbi:putative L-lysine-epsilon aminotransferase [Rubripirellula lacrimiformis]|uniref:Putative L-lysine-epsilon aminotransferase n=1 Tax=Rubripirellula lacrimiformis TaxID=1930273 RepID=A0A517NKU8_9BACT|nr:aminotransferase class III-fold pyridoxal phosphate-dependent enzyme [Rubripirellula lacrimiformis]QDT07673.1 putative L-lysine-epsilon aminotransferase [Rubripirellula lacrimiformis]
MSSDRNVPLAARFWLFHFFSCVGPEFVVVDPSAQKSSSALSPPLKADAFRADPRIAEAKRLIAEALADHGAGLTDVSAPNPELLPGYDALLQRLAATRGGPPFWPYLSAGLGNGPYVELADGSVKLDFIGGIGVHGCGHSHPAITDAAIDAAIEDTVMQGNLQQHPPSVRISEKLIQWATRGGAPLDHCLLSTSGAMANENALKIAMHHQSPADRVIAFDNAFAGRSLAMAALTDRPKYRMGLPLAVNVDYLPFRDHDNPKRSQQWAVDELNRLLDRHPGRYAAFWAEPIAGEGGYYPGSHDFFAALCEPLRKAGIPIIFDEIQSFARTSAPFAFQHYGLDHFADIVTVGKITQVCATLYGKDFVPKGPILSQTFTGSSSSIAAGMAMLELLESENCFGPDGRNMQRQAYFADELDQLSQKYPSLIHGPFGEGMMIAFTPGDGSFDQAKLLMDTMYEIGLLGFVCGSDPTRIRFLPPPVSTTNAHIDAAIVLLEQSLNEFAKKLAAAKS